MAELNKVLLIGRLTKDPELRYTPSGTAVADFRLAANHSYRTRDNEKREEVCFIDINVMGRSAEIAKEYLGKGREVFVEGRLQLSSWDGPDGQKRSKYRVIADRFQFLGSRSEGRSGGGDFAASDPGEDEYGAPSSSRPAQRPAAAEAEAEAEDDLPF